METFVEPINENSLMRAKEIIEKGKAVAFPTETVYGLGANAFSDEAVSDIYKIKGRPSDNPLIVHVHKDYDLSKLVQDVPEYSKILAEKFLPGPLTMVYKSRGAVSGLVSCGLDTLAIRVPSHQGAQAFLRYVDLPIAAPSANLSKHVSPVTAQHVYDDLNGKIGLILDGGKCSGGIESTVLDCTGDRPCILRSGLVTREMIASAVGFCDEYVMKDGERARSPGMKYKHYSPSCEAVMFPYARRSEAYELYLKKLEQGVKTYFMCDDGVAGEFNCKNLLNLGKSESEIAANLYDELRYGEKVAELIIAVAPDMNGGVMTGVMNRMSKAFGYKNET